MLNQGLTKYWKYTMTSTIITFIFLLLSLPSHSDPVVIPFETLWEVDDNETIEITTYNYARTPPKVTIDWGDNNIENFISKQTRGLWENETSVKHTYINKGAYKVRIYFVDSMVRFDNQSALKSILNWGNYGCYIVNGIFKNSGLERIDAEGQPNCDDFTGMFRMAKHFNDDLNHWDMSNVTRISAMFSGAISFNGNISDWETSNLEDVSNLFKNAKIFNGDISQWNTNNISDVDYLFSGAEKFNQDLSQWNLTKATNIDSLFYNAKSFKGPLPKLAIDNITYARNAFYGASLLKADLSNWKTNHINYCYHFVNPEDNQITLPAFENCSITGNSL